MLRTLLLLLAATSLLSAQTVVDVWPAGRMPGNGAKEAEAAVPRNDGFQRLTNVSRPTLTLFRAERKDGPPAPVMIVCPGGGYSYTVTDKEGSEIAAWFNTHGISALVLKYRTPDNRAGALQDAQRAISLTRSRAAGWGVDPQRVGIIGFSAGGHLAARTSTLFETRAYAALDAADESSCRPDFAVLVYPAYLDNKNGGGAANLSPKANLPPTLILHSEDDKTHVIGSKTYHTALEAAKIAHGFKLYPTGGHGYGLHCEGEAKAWPEDTLKWLQTIGMR